MNGPVTFILASDDGRGMNSSVAIEAHVICGQPVLTYVLNAAMQNGWEHVVLAAGSKACQVKKLVPEGLVCITEDDHRTGSSLDKLKEILPKNNGTVLFIDGNTPAITGETLREAFNYHLEQENEVTLVKNELTKPSDFNTVFNSNPCFISSKMILSELSKVYSANNNLLSGLTEAIAEIITNSQKVGQYNVANPEELIRVCDRSQLCEAESVILKRIIRKHMDNGVTFHLPETSMIHCNVRIGKDTIIHPGTQLEGDTVIGDNCEVGPNSRIHDGAVGNNVHFMNSVMTQSRVGDNTSVGPFAYIRPGSVIGRNIKIGDFVEIKNAVIGDDTKVSHLTYIGDADIGKHVNFGCGVVIVNYDGKKKHRTVVEDNAFIGCNVNLVSPVVVKEHAYIAAGSTITDEVPEYALAIARSRQTIIEDWVKRKGLDNR